MSRSDTVSDTVDLIVTPRTKEIFEMRTAIVRELRNFLNEKGSWKWKLHDAGHPGGATAKPFETFHNALDMKLYMRLRRSCISSVFGRWI